MLKKWMTGFVVAAFVAPLASAEQVIMVMPHRWASIDMERPEITPELGLPPSAEWNEGKAPVVFEDDAFADDSIVSTYENGKVNFRIYNTGSDLVDEAGTILTDYAENTIEPVVCWPYYYIVSTSIGLTFDLELFGFHRYVQHEVRKKGNYYVRAARLTGC